MKIKVWANQETLEYEDVDPAFSIDENWGITFSLTEINSKLQNNKIKPHIEVYDSGTGEALFFGTLEELKTVLLNEKNRYRD